MEKIAHLGPLYTFGHAATVKAAQRFLPDGFESRLCRTNEEIVQVVSSGEVNWGVLPISNSVADVVIPALDALYKAWRDGKPVHFYDEVVLPIEHYFIGLPNADLGGITDVASHAHAINQCGKFLRRLGSFARLETTSTAEGVRLVAEHKNPAIAAIGSKDAAKSYGLSVLMERIHDDPSNATRFMVISNQKDHEPTGSDSTWIAFTTLADVPGSLRRAIAPLEEAGISMHAVHSRATSLHSFRFYVGFNGHRLDPPVAAALEDMRRQTTELIILGSHPKDCS